MAQGRFVHGAASSGKSTIAKVLQAEIEKPFWHISIDHLRDSGIVPMERFRRKDFSWSEARNAFFDGFHASLSAYTDSGNNLIVEHILEREEWLQMLIKRFAKHDVFFVGVHCPLEFLIEREVARGDRPLGSARQDFETIHLGKVYDLDIDSTEAPNTNVTKLLEAWRLDRRSSSFSVGRTAVP